MNNHKKTIKNVLIGIALVASITGAVFASTILFSEKVCDSTTKDVSVCEEMKRDVLQKQEELKKEVERRELLKTLDQKQIELTMKEVEMYQSVIDSKNGKLKETTKEQAKE